MKRFFTWLFSVLRDFDFPDYFSDSHPERDETHAATRYAMACEGARQMPCADDTTPAECEKCKASK